MTRCIALLSVFALSVGTAHAFVDADAITNMLHQIDQAESSLAGQDATLEELLNELDAAVSKNADEYLQVDKMTVWDVPKTAWFKGPVQALMELGIVDGYKDAKGNRTGLYGPADNVTREQGIKIALGAAGARTNGCGSPKNSKHSGWAAQYVACAEQLNLGFATSTNLQEPATRAEIVHYTLSAFGINVPKGDPPFADSASHRYKNDIAYAYAFEIVTGDKKDGKETGTFRPNDNVNRGETAAITERAIRAL